MLVNKRLDLDIAIARVRKAHEADREARVSSKISSYSMCSSYSMLSFHLFFPPCLCQNLNANPLDDDYIAHVSYMFSFLRVKWLKVSDAKVA